MDFKGVLGDVIEVGVRYLITVSDDISCCSFYCYWFCTVLGDLNEFVTD